MKNLKKKETENSRCDRKPLGNSPSGERSHQGLTCEISRIQRAFPDRVLVSTKHSVVDVLLGS